MKKRKKQIEAGTICTTSKNRIFRVECWQTKPFSFQFSFTFDLAWLRCHILCVDICNECFNILKACSTCVCVCSFSLSLSKNFSPFLWLVFVACVGIVYKMTHGFGTPTPIISSSMNVMWYT